MYRSLFPSDLAAELSRWQRELQQMFDTGVSIRGRGRGGFPAVNVGSTPQAVEIYTFAPGLDPASLDVSLEKGVLTISGQRPADVPETSNGATVHINERFAGRFRRVISLTEDLDPNAITAQYRDGVLHISIKRREAMQPRRIAIQ